MAKKAAAKTSSKAAPIAAAGDANVPKDEIALKQDSMEGAESASTPVTASKSKGKKSSATEGVKQVDGLPASGGSGRKVRITEESPAQAVKRRSSGAAGSPDVPPSKGKKSAKNGKANGEEATMLTDDAPVAADPKFSPKHKDKARGLPEKSSLKKSKKRKADDEDDAAAADESAVQEAETSMAALSTSDEAEDGEDGEIDFLAGFESGSDDAEEDGADSSDDEAAELVSRKELPEPKQSGKKGAKKAGKGKKDEVSHFCSFSQQSLIALIAWSHLSRSRTARFPRGRDAVILVPVWRREQIASVEESRSELFRPPSSLLAADFPTHRRPVPPNTTLSSSLRIHQLRRSWQRPWTTICFTDTSSNARLCQMTRCIRSFGSVLAESSDLSRRAASSA